MGKPKVLLWAQSAQTIFSAGPVLLLPGTKGAGGSHGTGGSDGASRACGVRIK